MSQSEALKGIGGWLALLIVGLCILHPLLGAYQGIHNFSVVESNPNSVATLATWANYKHASWAVFGIASGLRIAEGISLLVSRQRSAVRFTTSIIWLCPLLSACIDWLLLSHYFGKSISSNAAASTWQIVSDLFWSTVWSLYLFNSARIRNTYPVRPNNSFKPNPLRGSA